MTAAKNFTVIELLEVLHSIESTKDYILEMNPNEEDNSPRTKKKKKLKKRLTPY